jgi:hypothetical protein
MQVFLMFSINLRLGVLAHFSVPPNIWWNKRQGVWLWPKYDYIKINIMANSWRHLKQLLSKGWQVHNLTVSSFKSNTYASIHQDWWFQHQLNATKTLQIVKSGTKLPTKTWVFKNYLIISYTCYSNHLGSLNNSCDSTWRPEFGISCCHQESLTKPFEASFCIVFCNEQGKSYGGALFLLTDGFTAARIYNSGGNQNEWSTNALSTPTGAGHQWTESTSIGCNQWLSLDKIALKVPLLVGIVHWWPSSAGVGSV